MPMRPKFSLYTLLWAIFFAAVFSAFYADYLWRSKNLTSVVVASRNLHSHHELTVDDIEERDVPISQLPDEVAKSPSEVVGKILRSSCNKGGPVFLSNVYSKQKISERSSYVWHDNSRMIVQKNFNQAWGIWSGRVVSGKGTALWLSYSTFAVGSFDGSSSIKMHIQLPHGLEVGDERSIKIVGNERNSKTTDPESGEPTMQLGDCEATISRFANPMTIENNLVDGSIIGTVRILEIGELSVKIELLINQEARYVGTVGYGLPEVIELDRRSNNGG